MKYTITITLTEQQIKTLERNSGIKILCNENFDENNCEDAIRTIIYVLDEDA